MISKIRHKLQTPQDLIAKPFSWLHPNAITLLGILPCLLFAYFVREGEYWWAIVMIILTGLDFVDGTVARMTGRVSKFGGVLDSSIDRVSDGLLIAALAYVFNFEVVMIFLISSFSISYVRGKVESVANNKFKLDVGIMERPERVVGIGLVVLLLATERPEWAEIVLVILCILSVMTVGQRLLKGRERLG